MPVMKRHSSEAMKTAERGDVLGISQTRPGRARIRVRDHLGNLAVLARTTILPGAIALQTMPVPGEVDRDLARQLTHHALLTVPRSPRPATIVLRGDVDHPPAHLAARLLLQHLPHGALAAQEQAAQADVQDDVPVLLARLEQALGVGARDHRVVDDHVEAAVAELQRGRDQPVDVLAATYVGLDVAGDPRRRR